MKRWICFLLLLTMAAAALAGCGGDPGEQTTAASEDGQTTAASEDGQTTAAPEGGQTSSDGVQTDPAPDETLDMEALLTRLAEEHPGASADELCGLLLENPFFRLFNKTDTEYYYPGLSYDFVPQGVKASACITDYISGSHALVLVFEPAEGTDAGALAASVAAAMDPYWAEGDEALDHHLSLVRGGKVFFALYNDGMKPLTGAIAGRARDFVGMFHDCLKDDPAAAPLALTEVFLSHQKLAEMTAREVEPGRLTGFGSFEETVEITGFAQGAVLAPVMSPNTFICYVFRLADGADAAAFETTLRENANLAWNVCVAADTVITERDGSAVLFMMCTEGTGE
jgi:hypothetical protein